MFPSRLSEKKLFSQHTLMIDTVILIVNILVLLTNFAVVGHQVHIASELKRLSEEQ